MIICKLISSQVENLYTCDAVYFALQIAMDILYAHAKKIKTENGIQKHTVSQ